VCAIEYLRLVSVPEHRPVSCGHVYGQ
jgi:hypothetical protein